MKREAKNVQFQWDGPVHASGLHFCGFASREDQFAVCGIGSTPRRAAMALAQNLTFNGFSASKIQRSPEYKTIMSKLPKKAEFADARYILLFLCDRS